LALTISQY